MKSIQGKEDKKDLVFLYKGKRVNQDEEADEDELMISEQEREIAIKVIQTYKGEISDNLNAFCALHLNELKRTLLNKSSTNKP